MGGWAINSRIILIAVGAVVLLIVLAILSFFIGAILVDIFLIIVALLSLTAFGLLAYAAIQVIGLVQEVRAELGTLVGTANDTLSEVRGTARFVSDNVVQPVSRTVAFVSATRATLRAFTEPLYKRRG